MCYSGRMEMTSVRLKRVREHLGLNQGGIAKKGGTIQSTWSNWEGGKLPEAFEVLKQLSTTYDLSTDYLLGLVDEPQGRVAGLSEAEERLLGLLRLLGPSSAIPSPCAISSMAATYTPCV